MMRQILCATDLSPASFSAVHEAVRLAKLTRAEVMALHVLPLALGDDAVRDQALRELDGIARLARERGVHVRLRLTHGRPVPEIVREAAALTADLIVIGTHGRGGFDPLLLGSSVEGVIRGAPCAVMTVAALGESRGGLFPPLRLVLCAESLSDSLRVLRHAVAVARDVQARNLEIVHVMSRAKARARGAAEEAARRLEAPIAPYDRADVRIEEHVLTGNAAGLILDRARQMSADLIVVGTHRPRGMATQLFGSTTRQVVRRSLCPVVVVPTDPKPVRPHQEAPEAEYVH